MNVPRFWTRVEEGDRAALGWSDTSVAEAERAGRERLARALGAPLDPDWDYYPSTPVREEILERPGVAGLQVLVTRNRAGARVLNVDRAAFVDVDLPARRRSLLGALLGRKRDDGAAVEAALDRARSWAEANRARLRAYRTARGLRLLRLDALVDPTGQACQSMFEAMGADPQYRQLCRVQASFRARSRPSPGASASRPRRPSIRARGRRSTPSSAGCWATRPPVAGTRPAGCSRTWGRARRSPPCGHWRTCTIARRSVRARWPDPGRVPVAPVR